MTRAYPNEWFVGKLVSLRTEWLRHNPPVLASGQIPLLAERQHPEEPDVRPTSPVP